MTSHPNQRSRAKNLELLRPLDAYNPLLAHPEPPHEEREECALRGRRDRVVHPAQVLERFDRVVELRRKAGLFASDLPQLPLRRRAPRGDGGDLLRRALPSDGKYPVFCTPSS